MKIHTGWFSKWCPQGHWVEAFTVLQLLNNEGKSAAAHMGKKWISAASFVVLFKAFHEALSITNKDLSNDNDGS